MRLAAADLHDRPALAGGGLDLVDELAGELRVAELVEVLHDFTSEVPLVVGQGGGVRQAGLFGGQLEPVAELLLEHPEVLEFGQCAHRGLLVKALDREADVDDDVLADLGVGYVLQADVLRDAAEVDDRHRRAVAVLDARESSPVPPDTSASPFLIARIPDQQLTERDAAVVGRHASMGEHLETPVPQRAVAASRSSSAFWNTPPDNATVGCPRRPRVGEVDDQLGDGAVEPGPDHPGRHPGPDVGDDRREHGAGIDHRG